MLRIKKLISGGQTGADYAGLLAAEYLGIKTGGMMPKGFMTLDGLKPTLAKRFGMTQHSSPEYPPRTLCNVMDSDGTIRFAQDFGSAGEKLTLKCCNQAKKPFYDVIAFDEKADLIRFHRWLRDNKIQVLNVAGNSETTAPGIGSYVFNWLIAALV